MSIETAQVHIIWAGVSINVCVWERDRERKKPDENRIIECIGQLEKYEWEIGGGKENESAESIKKNQNKNIYRIENEKKSRYRATFRRIIWCKLNLFKFIVTTVE